MTINRRRFLQGSTGAIAVAMCGRSQAMMDAEAADKFAALEIASKGRLGVTILDTTTGERLSYRGDERFAMLSTFKALAAGCVLSRVDRNEEKLDRRVMYAQGDVLSYAPVTKLHVADGLTMGEICAAAVMLSDNTAGNLMLASFGGPAGLTAWLRGLGDTVSRLDRTEPDLNEARPGDLRDTTTPNAIADTLRKLFTSDALSATSQQRLADWMIAGKTGGMRLRAGLPTGWPVGDKTGTNDTNCANDVAIVWPPQRAPLIIASFLANAGVTSLQRDDTHADVARIAAAWRT